MRREIIPEKNKGEEVRDAAQGGAGVSREKHKKRPPRVANHVEHLLLLSPPLARGHLLTAAE